MSGEAGWSWLVNGLGSVAGDGDLSRFFLRCFGESDHKNTVVEVGRELVFLDPVGDGQRSFPSTLRPFLAAEAFFGNVLLVPPVSRERQQAIGQGDFEIFGCRRREFGRQDIRVGGLVQIHRRVLATRTDTVEREINALQEPIHFTLEIAKRIPSLSQTEDRHCRCPVEVRVIFNLDF
jgi:hypothetical protein